MILAVVWSWGTNHYPEIENPLYRYQKLETILPETRNMTNAEFLALLMGDDPPQEIENLFYRFLTARGTPSEEAMFCCT